VGVGVVDPRATDIDEELTVGDLWFRDFREEKHFRSAELGDL